MKSELRFRALFLSLLLGAFSAQVSAADTESFRARLSPMPVTPLTVRSITGGGEVLFTLDGNALNIEGKFEGMSSAASLAHIHNGPMAQPGPVIHTLEITASREGEISGLIELTDAQVTALQNKELYIQIHSEGNPEGELRGWIFVQP